MNTIKNERIRNKYRIFLGIFLGFSIGVFCWATYTYCSNQIPDTIRIKSGTTQEFNLGVPVCGTVNTGKESAATVIFNQPLTIIAGKSMDSYEMELKLFGVLPLKKIDIEVIENTKLIPIGQPIGIYVKTQGVLVIDTGLFVGQNSTKYSPAEYILQAGDYITAMNGIAVTDKKQIKEYVEESDGKEIIFQISRDDEVIQVKVKPQKDEKGTYKIGVWLRDSAQGIGTMTYLDENKHFGALGHGINDMDTGELLNLGNGLLYQTEIVYIVKGQEGTPGELTGIIEYKPDKVAGVILDNTGEGIYGVTTDSIYQSLTETVQAIPVALKQDGKLGAAKIYCNIDGEAKYYDIMITKINFSNQNVNRQIAFQVTDETLLKLTGGIVQGMSGSPIIQDGKLIGAVTHVCVNL